MVLSLIIPVYNAENFLDTCLSSILVSKQNEIEVILVDDFSTDSSIQKILAYKDIDTRIKLIENTETGLAGHCRNKGVSMATGKYVWFIDADDWLDYLAIDRIIENINLYANTDIFSFGYSEYFGSENVNYNNRKSVSLKKENDPFKGFLELKEGYSTMPFSYVFKRQFLLNNKLFFPEGIYYEDLFFSARAFYYAKTVRIIPANLYVYNRTRTDSITNLHSSRKIIDFLHSYELIRNFLLYVHADRNYLKLLNFRFVVSGLPRCFRMYLVLKSNSCPHEHLWKSLNLYRAKSHLAISSLLKCKRHVDFLFHDDQHRRAELTRNLRFLFYIKYAYKLVLLRIYWKKFLLNYGKSGYKFLPACFRQHANLI